MRCIANCTLPRFLQLLGELLSKLARRLAFRTLSVLPTLKTKTGTAARQADPVNRMILLYRLHRERLHRRKTARTHQDLGLSAIRLLQYETYLDVMLHYQATASAFKGEKQICVVWDPSSYGGKEALVGNFDVWEVGSLVWGSGV